MSWNIFKFELRYWLRQPMVYVFFLLVGVMLFFAVSSENVTIGSPIGNVHRNAPFVVQNFYSVMSLLTMLMVAAFVQGAALRDFAYNTHQIVFSTPLKKYAYLMGRFWGAVVVALIPTLGVSLGILIGALMPWLDPARIGDTYWSSHLNGLLVFAIPNTIFTAAIVFAIAAISRSAIASFMGTIILLVGYLIAGNMISDLDNEWLAVFTDPFGVRPFELATKYWTVDDRNTQSIGLTGLMLINRVVWLGVGLIILALACWRFSFSERLRAAKKSTHAPNAELKPVFAALKALPQVDATHQKPSPWKQLWSKFKTDFSGILKSAPFLVILIAGVANMSGSLSYATENYGGTELPVTYNIIDLIRGTMYMFTIAIITIYSGQLIWKEREANLDQIYNALPYPQWVPFVAKMAAVLGVLLAVQLSSIAVGVFAQTLHGYTNYEFKVYAVEMLLIDFVGMAFLVVLSMFIHVLVNNKYIGFFVFIVFLVVNAFAFQALGIESNMLKFNASPNYTYSDMNGWGPFISGQVWFKVYWGLFCLMLTIAAVLLWVRGQDTAWRFRWKNASLLFVKNYRFSSLVVLALWILTGGFVFYNTKILNTYRGEKEEKQLMADYEKTYSKYRHTPQPRVVDLKYNIDLYPEKRDLYINGDMLLVNRHDRPIDSLHIIGVGLQMELDMTIDRAQLLHEDDRLDYQIYKLSPALAPGDSMRIHFKVSYDCKGFENEVSLTQVVPNGSFFNNRDISPQIGYQSDREMTSRNDRRKYKLPEKQGMLPERTRQPAPDRFNSYLSNHSDWVNVETVFSTSPDQIAVAPGSLLKEWTKNGRRYFYYRLDHESANFYSFISARFEVAREKWTDPSSGLPVDIEVYYHKPHSRNVPKMLASIKNTLDYASKNFGAYKHRQARIIEFPRYGSFAQAFPGTMPYSESIGFIANLEDEEDIDMVTYIVAHEMGHQWWAHQVVGANMTGATLLSETMAQYTALMVMEKTYGKDQIYKFLKYESDRYLRGRGQETQKERPLAEVDVTQGYAHYRKGSAVMYYFKEMIGEDKVNAALRNMVDSFAYRQPPYPTSYELLERFRAQTPDSLQYLVTDLFETITLFGNRTLSANAKKRADGLYEVTLEVNAEKFRSDSLGREHAVPINDWIEVGVLGKPAEGMKKGKMLAQRRVLISKKENTYTFVVDEEPYEAGIDPNFYLTDRIADDNLKNIPRR